MRILALAQIHSDVLCALAGEIYQGESHLTGARSLVHVNETNTSSNFQLIIHSATLKLSRICVFFA